MRNAIIMFFLLLNSILFSISDFSISKEISIRILRDFNKKFEYTQYETIAYQYNTEKSLEKTTFTHFISSDHEQLKVRASSDFDYSPSTYWMPIEERNIFIQDGRVHYFGFSDKVEIGNKVTIESKTKFSDINLNNTFYVPGDNDVTNYEITIIHPRDFEIGFQYSKVRYDLDYTVEKISKTKTRLSVKPFQAGEDIDYYEFNDIGGIFHLSMKVKEKPITFTQTSDIANWMQENTLFDLYNLDSLYCNIEIDSSLTEYQKVDSIFKYIQTNIRYIADMEGGHGLVPHIPESVLKNGYGDCKDMSVLCCAIAAKHGIKLKLVLASYANTPNYTTPILGMFDHVLVLYQHDGKDIFLDPTLKYSGLGTISTRLDGSQGYVLDGDNSHFIELKNHNNEPELDIHINSDIDSLKNANVTFSFQKDLVELYRRTNKYTSKAGRQNLMSDILGNLIKNIKFYDIELMENSMYKIQFKAKADVSRFVISSTKRVYIPKIPFPIIGKEILEREADTELHLPNLYHYRMNINLEGMKTDVVDSLHIGNPKNFYFLSSMSNAENHTEFMFEIYNRKSKLDIDECKNFLDASSTIIKNKKSMYKLSKEQI